MHRMAAWPDLATRLAQAAFLEVGERFDAVRQSAVLETILLEAAERR
jgi:hypothetical protein